MDLLSSAEGLEWLYLFVVLLGASFIHGALGMGFPLVFTALAAAVIDVKAAVFVTLIPSILINARCLTQGYGWRNLIRQFFPLALLAGLGSAFGTSILILAPPEPIKFILVISIGFYLLLDQLKTRRFLWIQENPVVAIIFFGLAAGLIGGITNAMGPILIIYFLENHFGTDGTVQGMDLCFLVGKLVQLYMFIAAGEVINTTDGYWLTGISIVVFATLLVGIKIRQWFAVETYRQILKIALGIIAVVLLVQTIYNF